MIEDKFSGFAPEVMYSIIIAFTSMPVNSKFTK